MEEEARCFLQRFVEEFPAALEEGSPLPVSPLSRRVSLEELHGESLELGLRLLAARGAPAVVSAFLCQAALSQLLQNDLSPFHCPEEAEANQEEEQRVVLLQSEAVQRLFLNKLIDVGLAWHQNRLKPPPSPSQLHHCFVHAIKNTRRKMEDKHLALAEFNQLFGIQDGVERAYYAVFDGHGGVDAATYAATHLHVALSKEEMLQSDAAAAFKTAYKRTDDMFRDKAKRERLRSGTTGVAVLIQGQELTVAWLGDSQAVLVRKGQAVTLMDPHKPEREDEKQRIEDLGGCITFMGCWRVNGTYAVSRAIGDFDQKPYVSGDADCSTTQLTGDEDYVLLACDGFFDAVKPTMVPHLVLDALQQPGEPEEGGDTPLKQSEEKIGLRVAQQLVSHAKAAGSSDNITVMLVFLRPPEKLLSQDSATGTAQATQDSISQDGPQQ
ncbi:protein phosphatase 1F [Seriola dumerili]|uniref:Protein phosphatase 1E n=1 Tax=Seriola dumerili TaxID=41447 RepID=A0A3B4U2D3_SERDU|nr:protein phosphatase 1F [Seriola dumerili]XP_022615019.1 protein phosphatase 1F [Seriola dumerili]XP_022615027.1 protein phosphatase 1F [Seriola dumerili]XP_022615037.1 protein phosphatase 1F [Seriola dumerili]XP_022615045.1 protein phosphatase 1F [Seriola dumerili]XP_022615054.1 protein phosphatase 1F [Seriola dumerili]